MKLKCNTCNKMKYDTAFPFKTFGIGLNTKKCLDCKYPHRWDEVKEHFKEILKEQK